ERRRLGQLRVRGDVVFDPQLRTCLLDEPFDPRARDLRLLGVELESRDASGRAFLRVVIQVTGEQYWPGLRQLDEQHLMARCVAGRRLDYHRTVAEYVKVFVVQQLGLRTFQRAV